MMSDPHDTAPLLDAVPPLCLPETGFHGYEVVNPDGSRGLWLIADNADDTDGRVRYPWHELDGPLPPHVQHRIEQSDLPRCGAPTKTFGRPCRTLVSHTGDRCHHHTDRR